MELQKPIDGIRANLPDQEEVRRRIATNLQERQLLRQLFPLTKGGLTIQCNTMKTRKKSAYIVGEYI